MRLLALPGVYRPDGDSAMIAAILARGTRPDERVLDVFTGTGVLAIAAARAGAESVCAIDVSRRATFCARLNALRAGVGVRVERGYMFEPVRDERFDTITANPPYVPSIGQDVPRGAARAWEGGADGRALLDPFLERAPAHLAPGGRLLLVHSSLSGIERTVATLRASGLNARIAAEQENPLGPVASTRRSELVERGVLAHDATTETIAVIEARCPAEVPLRLAPSEGAEIAVPSPS